MERTIDFNKLLNGTQWGVPCIHRSFCCIVAEKSLGVVFFGRAVVVIGRFVLWIKIRPSFTTPPSPIQIGKKIYSKI